MSFMEPEIYRGWYFEVTANHGETWIVPADVLNVRGKKIRAKHLADYVPGTIDDPQEVLECKRGWLARLSAPGYMDCTDWAVFETEKEAKDYLRETYGDDEETEE